MGLLAPLYALAALAIAGPILFHLIRRQPQGQQQFSSLMFLQPSPPRLTRRSRLDNWLLLLLRSLAIALIAFAFARPYLRERSLLNMVPSGRSLVVLLDTSASMQRDEVWLAAQQELRELVASLSSEDYLSLYTIDTSLTEIIPLGSAELEAAASQQAVLAAAEELRPSWHATDLAAGLIELADLLDAQKIDGQTLAADESEIILITDLHTDSGAESLQGFEWPEQVGLDVRRVAPSQPGNARPSLLAADEDQGESLRIRVENNLQSEVQNFQLTWLDERGSVQGAPTNVQVPPGQVRVVPLPDRAPLKRIRLTGDSWDADNELFVLRAEPALQRIAYVGDNNRDREDDPGYFLAKAPLSSSQVTREVIRLSNQELTTNLSNPETSAAVLELDQCRVDDATVLRDFARRGGIVLVIAAQPLSANGQRINSESLFLEQLFDQPGLRIGEAELDDFALIEKVDYQHPLFRPFSDPRYNDFSKIRIWSHRTLREKNAETQIDTSSSASELDSAGKLKTVASLDSGTPLLVQQSLGEGSIWLMTSGWQPSDSSLALSSKFVPILLGIFDPTRETTDASWTYEVGQWLPVARSAEVVDAQGTQVEEPIVEWRASEIRFHEPGLYSIVTTEGPAQTVAIRIPASESNLDSQDPDLFAQYGIGLERVSSDSERTEAARQLRVSELESKQKLWQWLLAAGILILAIETGLAGWTARRSRPQPAT
jgi:hypothetical protein